MKEKIKCPLCDAEFEVEMPDFLQDADCMYECKVWCKNCNNMVTIFTNSQIISEPKQLENETHLGYKEMTIEQANNLPMKKVKTIILPTADISAYKVEVKNQEICSKYENFDVDVMSRMKAEEFLLHFVSSHEKPAAIVGGMTESKLGWKVYFKNFQETSKVIVVEYYEQ